MANALDIATIEAALSELPGWSLQDNRLVKEFTLRNFREAISFMVRLSFDAEQLDHHPELFNVYNRVKVELTTHDAGNRVTEKDVALAKAIESFSWI